MLNILKEDFLSWHTRTHLIGAHASSEHS
jgi:hypothetical protein